MLFNSLNFLIFLPVVFIAYWSLSKFGFLKLQNSTLLIASYYFYGTWDYRFLFLLIFSTLLDYYSGLKIASSNKEVIRKAWLWVSVIINLGFLGFFKYYNFFIGSFSTALYYGGVHANFWTLKVILPVGISFYTFHGLSYIIDVYKKRLKPEKNFIDYALFVSFFPLLVAGPIERATHLLPQLKTLRKFNYLQAVDGLRQILWGFFKKLVIADNCAVYADQIFDNHTLYNGSTHILGVFYFAVQIYADFSGYSDIALGAAKLLGIDLLRNFNFPYLSKNMSDFWRRWHISLSTWFNDYLYTPLSIRFRNLGITGILLAVMITFFLSGLWHGAGWTFIIFGLFHGISVSYEIVTRKLRKKYLNAIPEIIYKPISIFLTFSFVCFTWIFFRSKNVTYAFNYISAIFSNNIFAHPKNFHLLIGIHICLFFMVEWFGRKQNYAIEKLGITWPRIARWSFYSFIIFYIGMYMATHETPFIYFQF